MKDRNIQSLITRMNFSNFEKIHKNHRHRNCICEHERWSKDTCCITIKIYVLTFLSLLLFVKYRCYNWNNKNTGRNIFPRISQYDLFLSLTLSFSWISRNFADRIGSVRQYDTIDLTNEYKSKCLHGSLKDLCCREIKRVTDG